MTEVSIRVDVLKGTFRIQPSGDGDDSYIAQNDKYHPLPLNAATLGGSVDAFMQSIHLLRPTPDQLAKQQAKAELGRKLWAERKAKGATTVGSPNTKQKKQS